MTKQTFWVLGAVSLALGLSSCSEVGKCTKGKDPGCFATTCINDKDCEFDLTCEPVDDSETAVKLCALKSGDDVDFGCKLGKSGCYGGDCMDGDTCENGFQCVAGQCVPGACTCEGDALCTPSGACVDFCAAPEVLPGSGVATFQHFNCDPVDETGTPQEVYAQLCRNTCLNFYQRQQWFCAEQIDPSTCDDFVDACNTNLCPLPDDPTLTPEQIAEQQVNCIADACYSIKTSGCQDTVCPDNNAPPQATCEKFICRNNCIARSGDNYTGDDDCDDGNFVTGKYNECDWGNDCGDCGPHLRADQEPDLLPVGSLCFFDKRCDGFVERQVGGTAVVPDFQKTEAWCLESDTHQVLWDSDPDPGPDHYSPVPGHYRCTTDCTRNDECPDGYECEAILDPSGNPFVQCSEYDLNDPAGRNCSGELLSAKACFPAVCK